jgi:HK97 family phage major capsid protein
MKFTRTQHIEQRAAEGGLVEMAIASEAPYARWWGTEILSCKAGACDLSRLADGRHPLLLNHDTEDQIGVIARAWLDNGVLRGAAKFSRSELGQEILQDVQDGIRSLVSVGYEIEELDEVEPTPLPDGTYKVKRSLSGAAFETEMRAKYGDSFHRAGVTPTRGADSQDPPTFLVTRWVPFEASVVPIPADVNVGIGRSESAPAGEVPPTILIPQEKSIMTVQVTDPAIDNNTRVAAIMELGNQYKQWVKDGDVVKAIRDGMSLDKFKDHIIDAMQSKHTDTSALHIGMNQKEKQRYSFGRALTAAITGDWTKAGFEQECSRAVAKLTGASPEGFFVPFEAWQRDFNVGTASEAGNLVPTYLRDDLFVDVLRNNLVVAPLGVRILTGLTGSIDMPRKSTAGTLGMVSEIGSASETNPLTSKVTLSPKRVSAYVEVSKQALIQAAMPLEAMIRDDLLMGAAVKLEQQYLAGTGTSNITGLYYTSSIGTTTAGANGAAPAWSHFVDLESSVANSNAEPDRLSGYVINTKTRGKLKQTQKGTNLPFIWDGGPQPLNGYRAAVTNTMPSNLTKGTSTTVCSLAFFGADWSMMVVGMFGAPDVVVDPYTKADTGQVKITLNQFADMGVRQPAAFSHIPDLLSN